MLGSYGARLAYGGRLAGRAAPSLPLARPSRDTDRLRVYSFSCGRSFLLALCAYFVGLWAVPRVVTRCV